MSRRRRPLTLPSPLNPARLVGTDGSAAPAPLPLGRVGGGGEEGGDPHPRSPVPSGSPSPLRPLRRVSLPVGQTARLARRRCRSAGWGMGGGGRRAAPSATPALRCRPAHPRLSAHLARKTFFVLYFGGRWLHHRANFAASRQ